jgi:two-component system, cell cycle sensor histidine kinase and response regulator CckA
MSEPRPPNDMPDKPSDDQKVLPRSADSEPDSFQEERTGRRVQYYSFAILAVVLALVVTLAIDLLATRTPFALFFAAVVAAAWYGGRNPGLLAIILSVLVCARFVIPPYSLIPTLDGALQLGVFVLIGLVINWLTNARMESEKSRRRSEERYRLLFESNPLAMWVYDTETLEFLEVNNAAMRQYGFSREEFLSMTIKDIRPPEEVPALMDDLSRISSPLGDSKAWRHRKKDGSDMDVEITAHSFDFSGRPARLVLATDVTERRTLEAQLRQSQKMEAIGLLAGGVAHDFNNLLTAITGYSELALRRLRSHDPSRHDVEEILKAGERAAALTSQLLAFSRKQVLQPRIIDFNSIVSEMEKMLRRLIGEDVVFRTVLDPELGSTRADPGQLEQVLMNLVINARDAMTRGGKLTIETRNVYLDEDYAKMHIAVVPGPYVMLAVSDTGVGMNEQTSARIFEPFFSTKEPGKGTGLGLSTIYGIVKQSGGNIWVYSEPGKGTTFKIYFPLVGAHTQRIATATEAEEISNGNETILLAEDEEIVRNLARQVLEMYGYRVLEAASGKEALFICEQNTEPIHLLITDVIMPEMGGPELASRVAKLCPETKVLYMSGYTDSAIVHQGELDESAKFIQKPFTAERLARKVREVLDDSVSK